MILQRVFVLTLLVPLIGCEPDVTYPEAPPGGRLRITNWSSDDIESVRFRYPAEELDLWSRDLLDDYREYVDDDSYVLVGGGASIEISFPAGAYEFKMESAFQYWTRTATIRGNQLTDVTIP